MNTEPWNVQLPVELRVMNQAIELFGNEAQLLVAVEEAGEFIQAAMKYLNRGGGVADLRHEVSDLLFLMCQMREVLGRDAIDACLVRVQLKLTEKMNEVDK